MQLVEVLTYFAVVTTGLAVGVWAILLVWFIRHEKGDARIGLCLLTICILTSTLIRALTALQNFKLEFADLDWLRLALNFFVIFTAAWVSRWRQRNV